MESRPPWERAHFPTQGLLGLRSLEVIGHPHRTVGAPHLPAGLGKEREEAALKELGQGGGRCAAGSGELENRLRGPASNCSPNHTSNLLINNHTTRGPGTEVIDSFMTSDAAQGGSAISILIKLTNN